MTLKQVGRKSSLLTSTQLKHKLNELSKEEVIELFAETFETSKEAHVFVSVKFQGEKVIRAFFEEYKEKIRKEFNPTRGLPKLRVDIVKHAISEMNMIGKGTEWPFELMVCFSEMAVQYIHANGDIFEDMCDCFTDMYEEVIQILNKEQTPELYEKYKERLKVIVETEGCECWGIHDSLEGSYSMLKWNELDEDHEHENGRSIISYAAMKIWLDIPLESRAQLVQNVWCSKCIDVVTIRDFIIQLDKFGIVLEGSCAKCSHQVARLIEVEKSAK